MIELPGRDPVSIRVKRQGTAFEAYYATGGNDYIIYRQAFLTDAATLDVGLMIASPTGQGFTARFEDFKLNE
jgi:regulation of enolase protein 1 (concanavalin A-like superfamily)